MKDKGFNFIDQCSKLNKTRIVLLSCKRYKSYLISEVGQQRIYYVVFALLTHLTVFDSQNFLTIEILNEVIRGCCQDSGRLSNTKYT